MIKEEEVHLRRIGDYETIFGHILFSENTAHKFLKGF